MPRNCSVFASRVASVGVDALGFTSIRVCYLRASSQAVTDSLDARGYVGCLCVSGRISRR